MGVLIFLIIIDVVLVGVVMYFVVREKAPHREHYVPGQAEAVENVSAATPTPAKTETRDWAVQTTSDSEADIPTTAEEVIEEIEEAAQHEQELDSIHEERLPADAHPVSLEEAIREEAEHPEKALHEEDNEGKDQKV